MSLVILLHGEVADIWELAALIVPFGVIFGLGILLIIMPIVRAQGDPYMYREVKPDKRPAPPNGHGKGHGPTSPPEAATKEQPKTTVRWEDWS